MKFNVQEVLQQAQKMQDEMEKIKQEIDKKTVTAEAGGGMVSVTMTGGGQLIALKIGKEAIDPEDKEMLEDLVIAAVNKGIEAARQLQSEEMNKVTGMLPNIPGLNLGI